MPAPVQFVNHGHKSIEALEKSEAYHTLNQAIEISNKMLDQDKVWVTFIQQLSPHPPEKPELLDPQYNMLLGIQIGDRQEPIDMIDLKALDEKSIKSAEGLAQEIVQKTKQHLAAKKIKEILISSSGSKFDTRKLQEHALSIDEADFLLVDGHRLAIETEDREYWVLRAPVFRSYTISRWVNEGEKIRAFDDYDLVRRNSRGMRVDVSKIHDLAIEQLVERSRAAAQNYANGYFLVERDQMTRDTIQRLYTILSEIPSP